MIEEVINGVKYKLPESLSKFQKRLYVHLINWKWLNITKEAGLHNYKGQELLYDAILPESVHEQFPIIYKSILPDLIKHRAIFNFKLHIHFFHMASSQAANVNLFLPILLDSNVNKVLKLLKPDFDSLASQCLYKGFRIEFWDGNSNKAKGLLGDHNARSGTDSDIAIAYYNKNKELCLWLIEHKLAENEFTKCGAFKSKGRNKTKHLCEKSFSELLNNKNLCYYNDVRKFDYWDITESNKSFFINHDMQVSCPFKGGMNQLWRNQMLGLALENEGVYKHVYFSVVKHPENTALDESIKQYKELIGNKPKFSVLTSFDILNAASTIGEEKLDKWIKWYKGLYYMQLTN